MFQNIYICHRILFYVCWVSETDLHDVTLLILLSPPPEGWEDWNEAHMVTSLSPIINIYTADVQIRMYTFIYTCLTYLKTAYFF